MPSPIASAQPAARPASSPRNAAMATSPWRRTARSPCCARCWPALLRKGTGWLVADPAATGCRDGATPVGGENGGRQTVRLRGGRAGSVTQESLVAIRARYQRVNGTAKFAVGPMLPDPGHIRREPAGNYMSFLLKCQFHEVTAVCRCERDFSQRRPVVP